jgi:hypothetical protein
MAAPLSIARKFSLAYLALAALLGTGIGLFVIAVEKPGPVPPPPWSAWKPAGPTPGEQQAEIATYVAAHYHLASGKRLVRVVPGGPADASDPIRAVALARTLTPKQQSDVLAFQDASHTAMYILCGDGTSCSINEGKASTARAAVLRREALELALYTFRYVSDANSVVAFFPPKPGADPTYALYFSKSDLSSQLHEPLRKTLPQAVAPVPGQLSPLERKVVDTLTTSRVYKFALQREQSGDRVLVLAPPTATN